MVLSHTSFNEESFTTLDSNNPALALVTGQKRTRLTQEDIPIEVHPLQLLVLSLLHQVREVGPQADVDGPSHLCKQGPQFLLMLPQGLQIELHMQGGQRSWACQIDTGASKT